MSSAADWNARYISGDTPWNSGHPSTELRRVVEQTDELPRGRLLELGCGTGTNAIYLARNGFEVTAVDGSQEAIDRAQRQADEARQSDEPISVDFHVADVVDLPDALCGDCDESNISEASVEPFDVLFDRGCYHCVRRDGAAAFVAMLERVTRSGTRLLLLAGNPNEPHGDRGPPRAAESELRDELGGCSTLSESPNSASTKLATVRGRWLGRCCCGGDERWFGGSGQETGDRRQGAEGASGGSSSAVSACAGLRGIFPSMDDESLICCRNPSPGGPSRRLIWRASTAFCGVVGPRKSLADAKSAVVNYLRASAIVTSVGSPRPQRPPELSF
ncbi:MAG: class I SAM-dependent methyltransferase [Pirellulales bacterium]